jgi:hypothetical protein
MQRRARRSTQPLGLMGRSVPSDDAPEIATAGGPVDKFRVTLAIYHPELEPDEVSARLGAAPTKSHRRGESSRQGSPPLPTGGWFLRREALPPFLPSDAIVGLFAGLPAHADFWVALRSDYKVQIRVAVHTDGWNRGFSLSPAAIACIAATGVEVDLDLYFYGSEYEA